MWEFLNEKSKLHTANTARAQLNLNLPMSLALHYSVQTDLSGSMTEDLGGGNSPNPHNEPYNQRAAGAQWAEFVITAGIFYSRLQCSLQQVVFPAVEGLFLDVSISEIAENRLYNAGKQTQPEREFSSDMESYGSHMFCAT